MKFRLLLALVLSAALPGMVDRPDTVSVAEVHSTVRSKGVVAVEALALRETCASFRVKSAAGHFVEMATLDGSCSLEDAKSSAGSSDYDWSEFEPSFSGRSALVPLDAVSDGAAACVRRQADVLEESAAEPSLQEAFFLRDISVSEIRLILVEPRRVGLSRVVPPSPRVVVEDRDGRRVAVIQAVWARESCGTVSGVGMAASVRLAPEDETLRLPASH